jgi:hypothetical protein
MIPRSANFSKKARKNGSDRLKDNNRSLSKLMRNMHEHQLRINPPEEVPG